MLWSYKKFQKIGSWNRTGFSKDKKFSYSDCLKMSSFVSTFPMMIQVSRKTAHLAQKCYLYKKLSISKVPGFFKSNFWPKSNISKSAYTQPLNLKL